MLILLAILPGLLISYAIFRADKYEREPLGALALCFAAGALATVPAVQLERWLVERYDLLRPDVWHTAALAFGALALNEELFKMGVLLLAAYPWRFFNEPLDGIVYAVLIAMGFATLENVVFMRRFGMETGLLRTVTAVPAHLVFAIIQGYFAGMAKFDKTRHRTQLLLRGLLTATLFHGAYDFLIIQRWSEWLFVLGTFSLYVSLFYATRLIQHHQEESPFNVREGEREKGRE